MNEIKNNEPLHAVFTGILAWPLLAIITSGIYFEQWLWKIHLYIHSHHFQWWAVYTKFESILILVAMILLGAALLVIARGLMRSNTPVRLLFLTLLPMYLLLALSYGVAQFALVGKDQLLYVLRDVAVSWFSFFFSVCAFVLVPLVLIVIGMLWHQRRSAKNKAA